MPYPPFVWLAGLDRRRRDSDQNHQAVTFRILRRDIMFSRTRQRIKKPKDEIPFDLDLRSYIVFAY